MAYKEFGATIAPANTSDTGFPIAMLPHIAGSRVTDDLESIQPWQLLGEGSTLVLQKAAAIGQIWYLTTGSSPGHYVLKSWVGTNPTWERLDKDMATEDFVNNKIDNIPSPMTFKGTIGTGGTVTTLPTATTSTGFTYKVITDATYSSIPAKVGDILISNGAVWVLIPSGDDLVSVATANTIGGIKSAGDLSVSDTGVPTVKSVNIVGSLPTSQADNFPGRQVTYQNKAYIYDGTDWKCDSDTLGGFDSDAFATHDHDHTTTYLGIAATATDSDKLDGKHASDFADVAHNHVTTYLGIDATAADSDKLDGKHYSDIQSDIQNAKTENFGYRYAYDLVMYGDHDKYYPFVIAGGDQYVKRDILIKRGYSELHPAEWHSSTHGGGLTLKIKTNFGGWGGANYGWEIHELEQMYNETFAGAETTTDYMTFSIFLRGGGVGGAIYHVYSNQPIEYLNHPLHIDGQGTSGNFPMVFYNSETIRYQSSQYAWVIPYRATPSTEEIRLRKFIKLTQDNDTRILGLENQTINYDLSTEPNETGTKTKTANTLWQNLFNHAKFLWLKLEGLFSEGETTNNNYLPKIDDVNKKLVKSNIHDDGSRVQIDSPLDLNKNNINNGGFEVVSSLPATNNFEGRRVTFQGRDYIWDGSEWESNRNWLNVIIGTTDPYMYAKLFTISNPHQNIELNLRPGTYYSGNTSVNYLLSFAYNRVVINKLSSNPDATSYNYNLHVKKITAGVFEIYVGMTFSVAYKDGLYADITNVRNSIESSVELFQTLDTSGTNVWTSLWWDNDYFTEFHSVKTNKLKVNGNLDLNGNQINNGGFEVVSSLPDTNNFEGRQVNYEGRSYIWDGSTWKCDADLLDGKHASEFATSLQGTTADNALQGIEIDSIPVEPSQGRIVNILPMSGATSSSDGLSGTVPKPLAGHQDAFLRGDGTFGLPNADVVASASYVGGEPNPQLSGMTCSANSGNVVISLDYPYVARAAFPGAVDIVRVMRNGLDLTEGEDFTIEEGITDEKKKITLIDYPLHPADDIILVRYKTSIGVYGSVFQETIDNAILVTNDANTAAQRAEDAADREILLSESAYDLLVQNDAVDLTKKYLIYEDDN